MGEGWFMGEERRMFHELQGDIDGLTTRQLQQPLQEIASGTSAFGPLREWNDWYHYLLWRLLPRSHENYVSSLLESLLTAFFTVYPNGVYRPPYAQFLEDALQTLGRCIMDPNCWDGDEVVVGSFLHRSNNNPNKVWCWWDASGDFSASLYFCLKYLPVALVREWFMSVLAIESPHWRAQILVWLVGSNELLRGKKLWLSELHIEAHPSVGWEWSHCLRPALATMDESGSKPVEAFIPQTSLDLTLQVVHDYFTEDAYLMWLDSIARVSYLEEELGTIPSTFESIYVRR
jgi:hypothetical protein